MGYMEIRFCDFCGKRTDDFKGRLTLTMYAKNRNGFPANRTVWGKSCCNSCFKKICAVNTDGDEIRDQIERYIDRRKIEGSDIKLIDDVDTGRKTLEIKR